MQNKIYITAQKDHMHFTNVCCICHKEHDDNKMTPIWINRISGFYPKEYLEPDYICEVCKKESEDK